VRYGGCGVPGLPLGRADVPVQHLPGGASPRTDDDRNVARSDCTCAHDACPHDLAYHSARTHDATPGSHDAGSPCADVRRRLVHQSLRPVLRPVLQSRRHVRMRAVLSARLLQLTWEGPGPRPSFSGRRAIYS
jgi:hypothetical protein